MTISINLELLQELADSPCPVASLHSKTLRTDLDALVNRELAELHWTGPGGEKLGAASICPLDGATPTAHITAAGSAKLHEGQV